MWATDADLAVLEPNLVRDAAWLGHVVSKGTAVLQGGQLKASVANPLFTDTVFPPRCLVLMGGAVLEVVLVSDSTTLDVVPVGDAARPPVDILSTGFSVVTYGQQIGWVHRQLLTMLGLRAVGESLGAGELDESAVTNGNELRAAEAYGALHLIYSAAGSCEPAGSPWNQRAGRYRALFNQERARVAARLDVDGDGNADVIRRLNAGAFVRG
jgi:hypothetical protein